MDNAMQMHNTTLLQSPRPRRKGGRGYSLLELLITVLIIQIISSMVVVNVSGIQATERLNRAANQVITALRYARMLSMSSGQTCGVEFDTANKQIRVFRGPAFTTVTDNTVPGGTYVIDLVNLRELSGITISSCTLIGTTTNPYRVTFGTLGSTGNNGTVQLAYGASHALTISIPVVGEAAIVP